MIKTKIVYILKYSAYSRVNLSCSQHVRVILSHVLYIFFGLTEMCLKAFPSRSNMRDRYLAVITMNAPIPSGKRSYHHSDHVHAASTLKARITK